MGVVVIRYFTKVISHMIEIIEQKGPDTSL